MSQPKPQARKCAHLLRWLSAGRGSTRSNSQPSTQIAQKSSASDAGSRLLVSRGCPGGCAHVTFRYSFVLDITRSSLHCIMRLVAVMGGGNEVD